jgi:hypothetical protein
MTPPTPDTLTLTRYALAAARRGWHVFPLVARDKVPPKGMSWKETATVNPDQIRRIWSRQPFNIGIACGPSGLVVLDLDTPKPAETAPAPFDLPGVGDGTDVLAMLCEQAGQTFPTETFTVTTRRGGTHLYFTAPAGGTPLGNTQGGRGGGLGWCIDTRAQGGYVVGPGSHVSLPDGAGTYDVIHAPAAAPLPAWLAERLQPAPLPPQRPVTVAPTTGLTDTYLRAAVAGELARVTNSPPHGHNTALYRAAVALGQLVAGGALTEADVTAWLTDAAHRVGQRPGETRRTIASGLAAGAKRPRKVSA